MTGTARHNNRAGNPAPKGRRTLGCFLCLNVINIVFVAIATTGRLYTTCESFRFSAAFRTSGTAGAGTVRCTTPLRRSGSAWPPSRGSSGTRSQRARSPMKSLAEVRFSSPVPDAFTVSVCLSLSVSSRSLTSCLCLCVAVVCRSESHLCGETRRDAVDAEAGTGALRRQRQGRRRRAGVV